MTSNSPRVSIITATYNRSNVLRYTVGSVLRSTVTDWEMIVVGDACTDDTEEVVASFRDPRIRFLNLPKNFGDQGGPNNEGLRHARSEYIAYLSHDDLWREMHLEAALDGLDKNAADLVFTLGIAIRPNGNNSFVGAVPGLSYTPNTGVPASLWVARRGLLEEVGPWKHPRECRTAPSQDLLLRAWRAGKKMQLVPKVTAILIYSGSRPGVYKRRDYIENRFYFQALCSNPQFWETEITIALLHLAGEDRRISLYRPLRRLISNMVKRAGMLLGISPIEVMALMRHGRKGAYINKWRKKIGLATLK